MDTSEVEKKVDELLKSNRISSYEEISLFLTEGEGGAVIFSNYANAKAGDNEKILNMIRHLGRFHPREALYVLKQIYKFVSQKESQEKKRFSLATLYFWIGDIYFQLDKIGYGENYLRAYLEDMAFSTDSSYKNLPAAIGLKVRCGLSSYGLELLHNQMKETLKCDTELQIKEQLSKGTRGEFEKLTLELRDSLSLELNDVTLNYAAIKELISQIEPIKKKRNKSNFVLLEQLCHVLFGSVEGFRYKFNEQSPLFQLDGVIYNASTNPFLYDLGKTIVVEAKQFHRNWISRKIIDVLAMNMVRLNASAGIIVTTARLGKKAEEEIRYNYARSGKYIIYLSFDQIKEIAEEKVSLPVLLSRKITDIRMSRRLG